MKQSTYFLILGMSILVLLICLTGPEIGWTKQENVLEEQDAGTLPKAAESGLGYLLSLVHNRGAAFDSKRVTPLLDLALNGDSEPNQLVPAKRESGNGGCIGVEIKAPLRRILRYAYNSQIPSFAVFPNALRLSGWYAESDILTRRTELWEELPTLDKPILLWGREYQENTPDLFAGTYYRYDLNRLIILMNHRDKKVLISVSKMPGHSQIGKKAVILDDKNWNYFYSGIEGLNRPLMGGVDTYIYDTESVLILSESDSDAPKTSAILFKWLKAGWAGINMVKQNHIRKGSNRFFTGFKQVIESEALSGSDTFIKKVNHIKSLSDAEINAQIRSYSFNFERMAKNNKYMVKKDFARIIAGGGYARVLKRPERVSVLTLECLKRQLGKPSLVELDCRPSIAQKSLDDVGA